MLLPLMFLIVADVIAIIHCWLMLLPFLCVAMIVWQMLLPLWLVVLPFDVIYVAFMLSFPSTKEMQIPHLGPEQSKMRCQNPNYNKRRNNNNNQQKNGSMKNSYMVVPYYQSLSESIKRSCKKYGVQVHFKGALTIRNLLMAPKDKDHILKKVESYTDIDVIGWSVMRSTLGNQQEHLLRGSKNI